MRVNRTCTTACPDVLEAWFHPMGLHLQVITNHAAGLAAAEMAFGGFGAAPSVAAADVTLHIFAHDTDEAPPQEPSFRIDGSLMYRSTGQASTLVADRAQGLAWAYISPQVVAQPTFLRHHFVEPAFHVMLQSRGLMAVHAAAYVKNGRALLIRAPSGAGKTTLAYAGARSRFQALAEDVVCIDPHHHVWRGLPWRFHLLPDARRLFPELAASWPVIESQGEARIEVDLETVRPGSTTVSATPGPVVFLRRLPGGSSQLNPLGYREAKDLWFENEVGNERDFDGYEQQVDELLRHATYQFDFGDDIDRGVSLLEPLFHRDPSFTVK